MGFESYLLDGFIYICIFSILSISLNLEAGFTKLMNFGKVAFFAVGAYTSAFLTLSGAPFLMGLLGGMLLAGVAGALIAIPTLRLREDYLAIVTIAFGEILRLFFLGEKWLTGGSVGLPGIPRPLYDVFRGNYSFFYAFIVFIALAICYLLVQRIVNSPFGRVLKAIREDEVATEALGKHIFAFKMKSLIIGSSIAGVSGSLFAHYISFIAPDMFLPLVTFSVWTMVVIGGTANNLGAILGAVLIQILERSTRFIKDYIVLPVDPANLRMMLIGFLLILFITYMPQGILKEKKMKLPTIEEET